DKIGPACKPQLQWIIPIPSGLPTLLAPRLVSGPTFSDSLSLNGRVPTETVATLETDNPSSQSTLTPTLSTSEFQPKPEETMGLIPRNSSRVNLLRSSSSWTKTEFFSIKTMNSPRLRLLEKPTKSHKQ